MDEKTRAVLAAILDAHEAGRASIVAALVKSLPPGPDEAKTTILP